ncbi:MAG: amidohydrolase [marine benthic group bacterium]|nr:amidohydrolase [Candidatus Benthicola marisminoris]
MHHRAHSQLVLALVAALLAAGCSSAGTAPATGPDHSASTDADMTEADRQLLNGTANGAWESTYRPLPSTPVLIRGGTVMTAAGEELPVADVLLVNGRIEAVGASLEAPAGAEVIDATGRFVTPGIIDTHSHLGVYPSPGVEGMAEGNEATDPVTAEVWAEHGVWPQDAGFWRALAGGVTTLQVLPGSANLIGGRGVTLKLVPGRGVTDMMFPGAPMGLKMACGENPKRVYANEGPSTRMGNVAGYRKAFIRAEKYRESWDEWLAGDRTSKAPDRDLQLETLAEVLRGNILIQNHCYRADDMLTMLELADEFGFSIRSFHHATEAYKIRDRLAEENVGASTWVDWWGFKMEALDAIPQNLALLSEAGAPAILHTDSGLEIQILNQNAARAMHAGRRAGISVSRDQALRWITINPAWALGIDDRTGSLEAGKAADVVIWSGDPFSVYSRADQVFIDGAVVFDRSRDSGNPVSDFELGFLNHTGGAR